MDGFTGIEILAGGLQDPPSSLVDMRLYTSIFDPSRNHGEFILSATEDTSLLSASPNAVALCCKSADEVGRIGELVESVVLQLAKIDPLFVLLTATRVNRLFRDTIKISKDIKTCLWKKSGRASSPPITAVQQGSLQRRPVSNPLLIAFDETKTWKGPYWSERGPRDVLSPQVSRKMDDHHFKLELIRHRLGRLPFACTNRRPKVTITLSDSSDISSSLSCADMLVWAATKPVKLTVRYRSEGFIGRDGSILTLAPRSLELLQVGRWPIYNGIKAHNTSVVHTTASTIEEVFQLAQEVRRCHPRIFDPHASTGHFYYARDNSDMVARDMMLEDPMVESYRWVTGWVAKG